LYCIIYRGALEGVVVAREGVRATPPRLRRPPCAARVARATRSTSSTWSKTAPLPRRLLHLFLAAPRPVTVAPL